MTRPASSSSTPALSQSRARSPTSSFIGRREIRRPGTRGVLRTISADGYVAHGINPCAAIIDEPHAFTTGKQRELFEAIDTAVHKRPDAYWLLITTAGHDRASLLGKLFADVLEQLEPEHPAPGLTTASDEENGFLLHWYGAEADCDADDEKLWKAVNPGSWVTVPELRRQRRSPSMATSTFKRRHLNAWVAPDVERWVPADVWEGLAGESSISPSDTIAIGGDGSRSYDTSALAWAQRALDGRIDVACRVFSVRDDVPHHVLHQGRIDYEDVQDSLLELAERFQVREVAFDPRFIETAMEVVAARIGESRVFPVEPHSRLHREALACFERPGARGRHPPRRRSRHGRAVRLDRRRPLRERRPAAAAQARTLTPDRCPGRARPGRLARLHRSDKSVYEERASSSSPPPRPRRRPCATSTGSGCPHEHGYRRCPRPVLSLGDRERMPGSADVSGSRDQERPRPAPPERIRSQ